MHPPFNGMFAKAAIRSAIAAMVLGLLSPSAWAYAANGCAAVNAGAFDVTDLPASSMTIATVSGFSVGDQLTFIVTGNAAASSSQFMLLNAALGGPLLQFNYGSTPAVLRYTVLGGSANDLTMSTSQVYSGVPLGAPNRITIAATCTVSPTPTPSPAESDASHGLVKGFLASRINGILLNDPGATSLLNRSGAATPTNVASAGNGTTNVASSAAAFGSAMGLGSGLGNAMGFGAGNLGDDTIDASGAKNIRFSQSLSQLRRQAAQSRMDKDRMALSAGDGGSLPLAYETASPWDVWVEGRYSAFDDDNGHLDRDGHVGVLYFGGDYRLAQNMIVGVLAQFDWSKDDSGALASKVDGNGWMIGPYLSAQIHDNIFFDLRAAWGRSSNDLTLGTATGDFDTSRWLVRGTLAGNWLYDAWRITPSAELAYVEESADSFTSSAGTFVAGQDVSLGRLQFGPEIGYRFAATPGAFVEPFAALKGVWDFDNPNVAIIDGYVVGPGDFWGRLQGGLNWVTSSGLYVRALASWDGLGAGDYSGYTLQGTVNIPLD